MPDNIGPLMFDLKYRCRWPINYR